MEKKKFLTQRLKASPDFNICLILKDNIDWKDKR